MVAAGETRVLPFRPAARRRVHEAVAEQLRDAILDGRFRAGDKLPPERELAREFQVNRSSIREAIGHLERHGLVVVRQGDGATVQPLVEASLDALPAMVFHAGRVDVRLLGDLVEVLVPLLREMGRLAIERHRPGDLTALGRLRDRVADEGLPREERFGALRDVVVALADMTGNRVWQMLARRTRAFLGSEPMRATRARLGRDPGQLVPVMDACLEALAAGRRDEAAGGLDRLLSLVAQGMRVEGTGAADKADRGGDR